MKKIIITTIVFLFIPFFIVINIKNEEKYNIKHITKKLVKVKKEDNSIISIPFEEYIKGVVSAEMPANFEIEALKAQAVAARSYVLEKIKQNKNLEYDILGSTMNQVYLTDQELKEKWKNSYSENMNKVSQAVTDTRGEYLTYEGENIQALFFSTSTGKTENSEEIFSEKLPYLKSVDSEYESDIAPAFNETITYDIDEFLRLLELEKTEKIDIEILKTTSTGRIKEIKINKKIFKATEISKKLNLKSTYFDIKQNDKKIVITTKGYGHGVGMSQYGAQGMALKGYKYDQILKHYYQGVEISKIEV